MHPEIVRAEPGSCPICGMALEPRTVTVEEDNPELRDMTRRFWISLALTAPLLAIAMGSMLWPHAFHGIAVELGAAVARTAARDARRPVVRLAVLPARLGLGRKSQHQHVHADCDGHGRGVLLQRGGNIIPADIFRVVSQHGSQHRPDVYFEAAAAIVTLVLLGQVLELRARSRTFERDPGAA